jgi:hypothetical protein
LRGASLPDFKTGTPFSRLWQQPSLAEGVLICTSTTKETFAPGAAKAHK